ncbi:hypothetical protein [Stenotrophomonas sp. NPDC078853]|uniref:hypothetical protein n=1 Tax=Stenotrophomonas sp. NPDC078853 TaxID=3364534 RepID=UPI00384F1697
MTSENSMDAFRLHAAREVVAYCHGLGIGAEHLDILVWVVPGSTEVQVRDADFGTLFRGAIRVGQVSNDYPVLTAGLIKSAIESELGSQTERDALS